MKKQIPPLSNRHPILVTGAHRSGTTWVGKMLTAGGQAAYISEPLNVLHRAGVLRVPVAQWYTYICEKNEVEFFPAFLDLLAFRYHFLEEARSLRSRKDMLRMGRDFFIFLDGRLLNRRPIIKDPFAVFSTPWFARRLGCKIVITVRHPAGFASSLKRLNWPFDMRNLLEQPLLMRDWLEPFREQMTALASDDIIGQASLLWRMIYGTISKYREKHPDFYIVRHEDLSLDPVTAYRSLYQVLGLKFTPRVQKIILTSSSSENPKEVSPSSAHAVKLDSRTNLYNWKRRLSAPEIKRIRQMTADVAARYYSDEEWERA